MECECRFSPDQLPGHVTPTEAGDDSPKVNRTVLDWGNDDHHMTDTNQDTGRVSCGLNMTPFESMDVTEQRRLDAVLREHEAMKASFLDIERCIRIAQEKPKAVLWKAAYSQLSRIPLPIFRARHIKPFPFVSSPKTRPSRIPTLIGSTGLGRVDRTTNKSHRKCSNPAVSFSKNRPSRIPVLTTTWRHGQAYTNTKMSPQKFSYSVYHKPGKHQTFIPEPPDASVKQKNSRLPVWMNRLRKSMKRTHKVKGVPACPTFHQLSPIPEHVSPIPDRQLHISVPVSPIPDRQLRISAPVSRIPILLSRIQKARSKKSFTDEESQKGCDGQIEEAKPQSVFSKPGEVFPAITRHRCILD